ncbi:MAG: lipopolysaccharide biosynthesis-like protein, partial [Alphaproteobacteria bacterium]|nr:lipopolysaccharide biosynthesis-like protein [Alphaproteobacteria bacterium]
MKRITIFAHFDKQNIIDDYVIDYLKELRKYSEIIFVSDGDLK